jgi:hypothetical protein
MTTSKIDITDPSVRDLAETMLRRLEAGVVNEDVYLAEMLETLERKRDNIAEAFLAGDLQADQAEHNSYVVEQQLEMVKQMVAGRAQDARLADLRVRRAALKTPLERIAFDNDPANGTAAERIVAMSDSLDQQYDALRAARELGIDLGVDDTSEARAEMKQAAEELGIDLDLDETRTDDELHAEHDQLEEADFYTGHKPLAFEAIVALTGDRAHAETAEAALVAADALCRDHQNHVGTHGALRAARATVYITENGTYAGILTAFARQGETRIA